jgi:hypothetical protein
LIGISLNSAAERGEPLTRTSYSSAPIFAVPDGSTTFSWFTAARTSVGETPFACIRFWSRLIIICRGLPP